MENVATNRFLFAHSGTSQAQRQLPGLKADYVHIDEHSMGDWIVFAAEFGKYLNYYDTESGAVSNSWHQFFSKDISAILGRLAVQNGQLFSREVHSRLRYLQEHYHEVHIDLLKRNLSEIISAIFTLSSALDEYYVRLPLETTLKSTLGNVINVKLAPQFHRLIAYYKAAFSSGLLMTISDHPWHILDQQINDSTTLYNHYTFNNIWLGQDRSFTSWEIKRDSISVDESIFGDINKSHALSIHRASNHFLFTSILNTYCGIYNKLIEDAGMSLQITLDKWDSHTPHYTLFLTFLKLFRESQAQLNSITWRHLDFYYKDILRLKPQGAIPARVHLIATLAKNSEMVLLPQGTQFKAGKDSAGKEVCFSLGKDTVLNKALAVEFRSIYKADAGGKDNFNGYNNSHRLFAAEAINSNDHMVNTLKYPYSGWHPFVNKKINEDGSLESINMPLARCGFAIASRDLFLAEGTRIITVGFYGKNGQISKLKDIPLKAFITTEKVWKEVSKLEIGHNIRHWKGPDSLKYFEITITLENSFPAVTAFNKKVHSGTYDTDVPIIEFVIDNKYNLPFPDYDIVKNIPLEQISLKVSISDGLKQLYLANQFGTLDGSKPFQPWGAVPVKESVFIIGCKELFIKEYESFEFDFEWADYPKKINKSDNITIQILTGGQWVTIGSFATQNLFKTEKEKQFEFSGVWKKEHNIDYHDSSKPYSITSMCGFLRLVLDNDFGHAAYPINLAVYMVDKTKIKLIPSTKAPPQPPPVPTIKKISLRYSTREYHYDLDHNDSYLEKRCSLYTIDAFGEAEIHKAINGSATHYLFPNYENISGQLFIGFEQLSGNQSVALLFSVSEGSTNPLVSKPADHVHWSYLSGNQWKPFDFSQVHDYTRQLVQSGIVELSIPGDATTDNTILPGNLLWISVSVNTAVEAVCKIISIQAQAMQAVLVADDHDENVFASPFPAATISKLKQADSRIKSVNQPYSSFGGRPSESQSKFYQRSSERLRHKGRAVTMWDYERIVLEEFPELYKVKCCNHTRIEDSNDASKVYYSEMQPGYVAIITLPDLKQRTGINVLKPYTSQNLLLEIEAYLKSRVSEQVIVQVRNPLFEEIFVELKVKFASAFTDVSFYLNMLQQDITKYLTPWAFDTDHCDVEFGGCIHKSSIINFVEERSYVDVITDVVLKHKPGEYAPVGGDVETVRATTARSILVSAPSARHLITVLK